MSEDVQVSVLDETRQLRRITRVGFVSLAVWAALLLLMGARWPEPFTKSWRLVLGQMMAGRAYSVSEGLALGFPKVFLLFQVALQDIIILLLLYRLLVAGYKRVQRMPVIGPAIANIHASAERHKNKVEPYGAVGIALFVLFPFWSTGPLAGSVLGYMLGIRTWLVFVSVIIGNFLCVACWIWIFDRLFLFMQHIGAQLPISLPLAILLTVVIAGTVSQCWKNRRRIAGWIRRLGGRGASADSRVADNPIPADERADAPAPSAEDEPAAGNE